MRRLFICILATFLIFSWGCSSTRTKGERSNPSRYSKRIGNVTAIDFYEKTLKLLQNRYQYNIIRREQTENEIYIETNYLYRSPFEDERRMGIVSARTRIIIRALPRTQYMAPGATEWVVRMTGESQVQVQGSEEWVTMPMTDQAYKYFEKIRSRIKLEYDTGIQKYNVKIEEK